MTHREQLTNPVMGGCASLHADNTLRKARKELQHIGSTEPLFDHSIPIGIDTVDLEEVFRDIKTNRANLHGGWLPSLVVLRRPPLYMAR